MAGTPRRGPKPGMSGVALPVPLLHPSIPSSRHCWPPRLLMAGEIGAGASAETAKGALSAARVWITDGNHTATRLRVVDGGGTIVFDQPVTEVI
jgi:hypothetical protein